jgi:heat shock protein HtpX
VRNYDVRLMTYAAVLAGSIALLAQLMIHASWGGSRNRDNPLGGIVLLLSALLAPLAATIIQLAISRKREFLADASAAELTRYPAALASALEVISGSKQAPLREQRAIAHMMFAPQLTVQGKVSTLFATHPPTEERIALLLEMAGGVPHSHGEPVAATFRDRR